MRRDVIEPGESCCDEDKHKAPTPTPPRPLSLQNFLHQDQSPVVTLSAAKGLVRRAERCFAALSMTGPGWAFHRGVLLLRTVLLSITR